MNRIAAIAFLALLVLPPPSSAQVPEDFYDFLLKGEQTTLALQPGSSVDLVMKFYDLSKDSTGGVSPVPGVPNASPNQHSVRFEYKLLEQNTLGWFVLLPPPQYTFGGEVREVRFTVGVSQLVQEPFMPMELTAVADANGRTYRSTVNVTVYTLGVQSFNAQPEDVGGEIKPGAIVDVPVRITNGALVPRGFDIEVSENPCNMLVATSGNNLVGPKETKVYTVSARAPEGKLWYFSEICTLGIQVAPNDAPSSIRYISAPLIINGGFVDPQWVINTVFLLLILLLLLFLLARRKARVEEEILGKPQKPWLIPVEALYLKALRRKDSRAWYVVRHYLMEDEYRSSLLWYKAYKGQTKGSRKKEALVLRQEKAYERWKKAWAKDIAKPIRKADRFEAKLQRKLDRKADKAHRKQMAKYHSVQGQMEKAHAKQVERVSAQHEKAAAKARKKGQPIPPKPIVARPDYPDEPEPVGLVLAEHKWAKKAARHRARQVRRQGDLEVKFEKADARRLRKVRRKVQRMARRLDDPEFIAEHPLLQGS
ncbi:MAG TPA: hypothetical protein VJ874_03765 [Candidatus Thermoplasmatota archaeon]|nr:hypothetical protein [Candidatus Thermoplasmatota archaeon]